MANTGGWWILGGYVRVFVFITSSCNSLLALYCIAFGKEEREEMLAVRVLIELWIHPTHAQRKSKRSGETKTGTEWEDARTLRCS